MRRATPDFIVLIHVVSPFFAVAKEHVRLVAVLKEAHIWVQIILDVVSEPRSGILKLPYTCAMSTPG